ncbi:outer membrane beta-barrel family protein [Niabella soli]|uniref:TonB-denpendent receptor n=1 Tax=Niabella soli DSM 19437 TaxID=929713 RepID=W0EX44_9BACT|nr:outer membrane beta-barrel family protein [Niabella soli]AHF15395.1 TonB-denpendent receptor [Niabella soli DSM 19437]
MTNAVKPSVPRQEIVILLLIFIFSFFPLTGLFAQFKIAGKVVDSSDHKGVPYVTIVLKAINREPKDSLIIDQVRTDENGWYGFSVSEGDYRLLIEYFGRGILDTSVQVQAEDIILGTTLVNLSRTLQAVTVNARKPLIERKLDRTIFNVGQSIASQGMNMLEMLKNVPLVQVSPDESSINLQGKGGVRVMINERPVYLSGNELANYLKSFRSEDVEKVEVITMPPSKYEAEGNSGLLNIVLKKNQALGWSGNLSSSYQQVTYPGYSNSIRLNYQSKKLNMSYHASEYDRKRMAREIINIIGDSSIFSTSNRKDRDYGLSGGVSLNYKLASKSNIGFIYDANKNYGTISEKNSSVYVVNNNTDSILTTPSQQNSITLSQTANLYYDVGLDTLGKKLNIGVNYFYNDPDRTTDFQTAFNVRPAADTVRNTAAPRYQVWSGKADLELPSKWINTELGASYTWFRNQSDLQYLNYADSVYSIDQSRSNIFLYNEGNWALYASFDKQINPKWSAKAGLRYEYSSIDAYSRTLNQRNKYNYGNFFPTIYIQYKLKNHVYNISYARRINRPGFTSLNPFRWYSNLYSYYTGNPFLRPSYNENLELAYLFKNRFSARLYGQKTSNGFSRITLVNKGVREVIWANFYTQYNVGINLSLNLMLRRWWESYIAGSGSYVATASSAPEVRPVNGIVSSYNINNTLVLNKNRSFSLLVNFSHILPAKKFNISSHGLANLTAGVKWSLLNNTLFVNAVAEDIFKTLVTRSILYYDRYIQTANNYYDSRGVRLSVSYNFGRKKVRSYDKEIQFDEKNRAR